MSQRCLILFLASFVGRIYFEGFTEITFIILKIVRSLVFVTMKSRQ